MPYTRFTFPEYTVPFGWLPPAETHIGAHGLFYYAMQAKKLLNTQYKEERLVYEDELWPEETRRPFEALFNNILAIQYEQDLNVVVNYWGVVNRQLQHLKLDLLPDDLMFAKKIEITSLRLN